MEATEGCTGNPTRPWPWRVLHCHNSLGIRQQDGRSPSTWSVLHRRQTISNNQGSGENTKTNNSTKTTPEYSVWLCNGCIHRNNGLLSDGNLYKLKIRFWRALTGNSCVSWLLLNRDYSFLKIMNSMRCDWHAPSAAHAHTHTKNVKVGVAIKVVRM